MEDKKEKKKKTLKNDRNTLYFCWNMIMNINKLCKWYIFQLQQIQNYSKIFVYFLKYLESKHFWP